jgi:hypothetical protein
MHALRRLSLPNRRGYPLRPRLYRFRGSISRPALLLHVSSAPLITETHAGLLRTCLAFSFGPVGLALWRTDWATLTSFIFVYPNASSPRFGLFLTRAAPRSAALFAYENSFMYSSWPPIQNHVTVSLSRIPRARYPRVMRTDHMSSSVLTHLK